MIRNIFTTIIIASAALTSSLAQSDVETFTTTYKVNELMGLIDRMYVEDVDREQLELDFIRGMHNSLSPFQAYHEDSLLNKNEVPTQDKYQGIGISFKFKRDTLLVKSVIPGSGAANAWMKEGDKIIKIGDRSIDDFYSYLDVTRALTGEANSTLSVTLLDGDSSQVKEIVRNAVSGYSFTILGDKENTVSINEYEKALNYFDAVYADTVTNSVIVENGIRYMLDQLDPHSAYISLKDIHDMNAPLKGSFSGVGVRFQIVKDTITVVQAIPGGPSEKVGIQAGDQFVEIDEEIVAGTGINNTGVRDRLLGDKGTKVQVKMKRGGSKEPLEFTIERDKIPIYSLDASYMAAPKVGYVKLNNFSATTVDEVKKAVRGLRAEGMEDLIIDLQSNGGGYLMTAINLVDELLDDDKLVVYTQGRTYPKNSYGTRHKGDFEKGRLIVLINESSASASEIVSGAIQDWDRGLIIGRRSFGKGLVQKPIYLTDGTQVRITTQRYYTPSGRCIQKSYENGTREYRKEKYERYTSGESFNEDSIHFIDSLKFETKVKNRTVYGGGGIMPDVFVPLDTNGTSKYYSSLIRKGIMNRFALTWVNKNRKKLESKYISFDKFKSNFNTDKVMKELFKYAKEEGLEYNDVQYLAAENTIKTRLKANIAQNLYDYRKFYEIINDLNSSLQEALKILKVGDEFDQLSAN